MQKIKKANRQRKVAGRANLRSSHEFAPYRVTRGEGESHSQSVAESGTNAAAMVVWMNARIRVKRTKKPQLRCRKEEQKIQGG